MRYPCSLKLNFCPKAALVRGGSSSELPAGGRAGPEPGWACTEQPRGREAARFQSQIHRAHENASPGLVKIRGKRLLGRLRTSLSLACADDAPVSPSSCFCRAELFESCQHTTSQEFSSSAFLQIVNSQERLPANLIKNTSAGWP